MTDADRFVNLHHIEPDSIVRYLKDVSLFGALSKPRTVAKDPVFASVAGRLVFSSYRSKPVAGIPCRILKPRHSESPVVFAYRLPCCLLLVFRGTANSGDLLRDAWTTSVRSNVANGALVHTGIFVHTAESLFMCVKELCDDPALPVVCAGHSLGAAVAKLMARGLGECGYDRPVRVLLFSCPSVSSGGEKPAALRGISYTNRNDLVTTASELVYRSGSAGLIVTSVTDSEAHTSYLVGGVVVSSRRIAGREEISFDALRGQPQ